MIGYKDLVQYLKDQWEETSRAFARLYTVQSNFLILILALPIVK